jgi:DNA modification methylase
MITLKQGDCLELMKELLDKSVDCLITDPPYGKRWTRGINGVGLLKEKNENPNNLKWDKERPKKDYFNEILRIGKNSIIWGGNYFTDYLFPSNCWIVWDKDHTANQQRQMPYADCELAWTSFNMVVRKFTLRVQGFISDSEDKRVHPTQKPTELMRWVIQNYTKEGDTILDPFMGSGTTGVACKQLGRNFIGYELDPEYFEMAKRRIEETNEPTISIEERESMEVDE